MARLKNHEEKRSIFEEIWQARFTSRRAHGEKNSGPNSAYPTATQAAKQAARPESNSNINRSNDIKDNNAYSQIQTLAYSHSTLHNTNPTSERIPQRHPQ